MELTPLQRKARGAAKASWFGPLIMFLVAAVGTLTLSDGAPRIIMGLTCWLITAICFVAAVFALATVPKVGWRGVLIPALIGLAMTSFLLFMWGIALVGALGTA